MYQDTKPAPFALGDHVRYVGPQRRELPTGQEGHKELVLTPGMAGVILMSTGALAGQDAEAHNPWRCRVQFQNGFQLDITPANRAAFELTRETEKPGDIP